MWRLEGTLSMQEIRNFAENVAAFPPFTFFYWSKFGRNRANLTAIRLRWPHCCLGMFNKSFILS